MSDTRFPVACSKCGAPTGQPCVSCNENYTLCHTARYHAAKAAGLTIGNLTDSEMRRANKVLKQNRQAARWESQGKELKLL